MKYLYTESEGGMFEVGKHIFFMFDPISGCDAELRDAEIQAFMDGVEAWHEWKSAISPIHSVLLPNDMRWDEVNRKWMKQEDGFFLDQLDYVEGRKFFCQECITTTDHVTGDCPGHGKCSRCNEPFKWHNLIVNVHQDCSDPSGYRDKKWPVPSEQPAKPTLLGRIMEHLDTARIDPTVKAETNCQCEHCVQCVTAADLERRVDVTLEVIAQWTKEEQAELYRKMYVAFDHCRIYR